MDQVKFFNPLSAKFIKWSNTLKQIVGKLPTICLSVFDHFSGLALKGLKAVFHKLNRPYPFKFFKGCLPQNFTCSILEYLSKEQLLSFSILSYQCYYQSKNFKTYTIVNTNINDGKSCKVGAVVEF